MLGREVLGIRKLQGVNLDRDYVTEWAQRLGVVDALTQTLTIGRTLNKYVTQLATTFSVICQYAIYVKFTPTLCPVFCALCPLLSSFFLLLEILHK